MVQVVSAKTEIVEAQKTRKPLVELSRFRLPKHYRNALENERLQQMWKRQFGLPDHVRVIKVSVSVCPPVCSRQIPMAVYEEDGAIWLKKTCPEHGTFRDLYWGDAELYYYFLQWDAPPEYIGKGTANPNTDLNYYLAAGSCPQDAACVQFTRQIPYSQ